MLVASQLLLLYPVNGYNLLNLPDPIFDECLTSTGGDRKALAEAILKGGIKSGAVVRAELRNDGVTFRM